MSLLFQLRHKLNKNQREFVKRLKTSRFTYHNWESGKNEMKLNVAQIKELQQILAELGLDISDLPDTSKRSISKLDC